MFTSLEIQKKKHAYEINQGLGESTGISKSFASSASVID